MTTIHDVLKQIRDLSTDKVELGTRFEQLMVGYLKTDPTYVDKFEDVWRWVDWPDHVGGDTGIDIVAKERDGGGFIAIQCKFYDAGYSLQKGDIDSFFTASGKEGFTGRIIISTTDNWSTNAEKALEGQQIPTVRLRVQDLDQSDIDWSKFIVERPGELARKAPKAIRPHQRAAINDVIKGFENHDRGQMILACGTGKTFTSLKLVEEIVPLGGSVLFMVPSISLLSQSLKAWSSDSGTPLRTFAVCSDVRAGKRSDNEDIGPYDLAFPATTNPEKLAEQVAQAHKEPAITVIFSTYQSIEVITKAQEAGLPEFDLIVCDEAHRTTGAKLAGEEIESTFTRIHENAFVKGKKRLYMTATPRIYDEASKSKAAEGSVAICSMDDETKYGPEFHYLGFGTAVANDLLTDYKVLVLAVDEAEVSKVFQHQLADEHHELNLDDAARIVGCWNGLAKRGTSIEAFTTDPAPMRRAVAFTQTIKDSKHVAALFEEVSRTYAYATDEEDLLRCEVKHVDGTQNALVRKNAIDWIEESTGDDHLCRILSNAKCLTEGVDVPALDAVLFLNPRKSVIDVVQAVGRVMRRAEGKNYGYIILPIGVPAGVEPEEALADNERYRVVWQVLQALRAVDDRIDAEIHQLDFDKKKRDPRINVIGTGGGGKGDASDSDPEKKKTGEDEIAGFVQGQLALADLEKWREAIYAKLVQKVGDRKYWENWAKDIAQIAERHIIRINTALDDPSSKASKEFDEFLAGLRANLNDSISREDAIEMLAQHIITKPVFDAVFEDYEFTKHNPVSQVMDKMATALEDESLDKEAESLEKFYESVRVRVQGIESAEGRQRIITELYEKFFRGVFKKTTESLGIVYTPIEIVDFIINSVESVLQSEFGSSLNDEGVHVLDPFTGTGTFIVRLIQSGVISPDALAKKYANELHANELVLLAYYIAAINIESAFHEATGAAYTPFEGVVLTDTFQMSEGNPADDIFFPDNNERARKQRDIDIRVILGNPPYSVGQGSQNDNNRNLEYPKLDEKIRNTYAKSSSAALSRNLFDSYIRAFRWSSDRIGDRGVICFITNGGWIDSNSADGFRKALAEEFTSIYCLDLRGNIRGRTGDAARKEGGSVFNIMAGVAIALLVKDPTAEKSPTIRYCDVGDYLSRDQKLSFVSEARDVAGVDWRLIIPNEEGDWINQRSHDFETFPPLGDKKTETSIALFGADYSLGVVTNRDAWAVGFSQKAVATKMRETIGVYNDQLTSFKKAVESGSLNATSKAVDDFITTDPTLISWSRSLKGDLRMMKPATFDDSHLVPSAYRPFTKQWLYFDRQWNEMVLQVPRIFPDASAENIVIAVSGVGSGNSYSIQITDVVPNMNLPGAGSGAQCFPLYVYDLVEDSETSLFSDAAGEVIDLPSGKYRRRYAITDATLETYQSSIDKEVTKEDIFYCVYGLLHSPEYQRKYAADLGKMIPRIPVSKNFWKFSDAGRKLAHHHLNYETIDPWPLTGLPGKKMPASELRVEKMTFKKIPGKRGQDALDRSTIIVNSHITLEDIPAEAYEYQVNGKSAVDWILDRYQVKTDKDSGIVNDPNDWSDDPRYIVDLVARIVRVSIESAGLIQGLPKLDPIKNK
jgi:predicted helicase